MRKWQVYNSRAGSKAVAGRRKRFVSELGRTRVFSRSCGKAEQNAMTRYVALVVGLSHSRGVNRVMPVENNKVHSKDLAV